MTAPIRIPFNRASFAGDELALMQQAVEEGHISGDGAFTRACAQILEAALAAPRVLLTTSCTHALEMAALLLRIGPGDEVILPSFTFVSAANAFVLRGATPVFADCLPETLNIDPRDVERKITPRTKALVVMHYAGVGCDMEALAAIAEAHRLPIVEDNAHGLFGAYRDRPLGSFGALSTLSFHETKNFTCGEGGALVINDPSLVERAEILREKGTNRTRFFRGQVDKYSWVDVGSSYLPSDLLAAFLLAQLKARDRIQGTRQRIWCAYADGLRAWAGRNGIALPVVPGDRRQSFHLFYLLFPTLDIRQAFIAHLRARGIMSVFHYLPLHLSEMGLRYGGAPGDCPVTEALSDRLARLPLYASLGAGHVGEVIDACTAFRSPRV